MADASASVQFQHERGIYMDEYDDEDRIIEEMVCDPTSHPDLRADPTIDRMVRETRSRLGLDNGDEFCPICGYYPDDCDCDVCPECGEELDDCDCDEMEEI
jgi:hypothetical protein